MYHQHVQFGRRGAEACHMVGVKNKEDLFYVVAAPGFLMAGLASGGGHWGLFRRATEIDRGGA